MTQVKVGADRVIAGTGNPVVIPPYWRDLGQDATIAAESTALAQSIGCLTPYDGKIYLGYGDSQNDTGPTSVRSYEPGVGFATEVSNVATEAMRTNRVVDGDLWMLSNDARGSNNTNPDYVHFDGSTWTTVDDDDIWAAHVYDICDFGGDLFLAGSACNSGGAACVPGTHSTPAAVWRSTDGGSTWAQVLSVSGRHRAYFIFPLNGYVWVQTIYLASGANALDSVARRSSNGTSWSNSSVNLLPQNEGCGWKPYVIGSQAAYLTKPGTGEDHSTFTIINNADNYLTVFDGSTTVTEKTAIGTVYDHHFDGTTLYVLTQAQEILTTTDLSTFTEVTDDAPAAGRSICVDDEGVIYVGTTDSHLWKFV
jgi:hypothetical protein